MSYRKQVNALIREVRALVAPPPEMTVSEWAREYRYLSAESSAAAGKYDLDRVPHCDLPMQMLSPNHPCKRVLLPWSSQIAKTTVAENFLGYIIHQDPAPTLVVQPNVEPMGKEFSTGRLAPMIRDNPVLRDRVQDSDKRGSGNTIGRKSFAGGYIAIAGANSPSGLASRPVRFLINDELNRWEATKEGDSLALARKRLARFHNSKELTVSSQTFEGVGIDAEVHGAIDDEGERGKGADQIYYWSVACLKCGKYQYPQFRHFKFEDNDPETVEYECEDCGHRHTRDDETAVKETGEYILDYDEGVEVVALYANVFGVKLCSWADSIDAFLRAKGDPAKLQVVVNTDFNENWRDLAGEGIEGNYLFDQRETYPAEVPAGGVVLTCGADIQADRIEAFAAAWSEIEEVWAIDYQIFDGDTSNISNPVWDEFEEYLKSEYSHEGGELMRFSAVCIDAGYLPSVVDAFIKRVNRRNIWAVLGRAGKRGIIENKIDKSKRLRRSRSKKKKREIIGVDEAKTVIYSRLKLTPVSGVPVAGFCHFPISEQFDPEYFDQLTAERVVRKLVSGQIRRQWFLKSAGQRNEALDCFVYAFAALRLLAPKWAKYVTRLVVTEETPETIEPEKPQRRRTRNSGRKRGGFVTNY